MSTQNNESIDEIVSLLQPNRQTSLILPILSIMNKSLGHTLEIRTHLNDLCTQKDYYRNFKEVIKALNSLNILIQSNNIFQFEF